MLFRLVPKSMTLDDLELIYVQIFAEFCASSHFWEETAGLSTTAIYGHLGGYFF